MIRAEFLRGWLLLTTQPWGKVYRATGLIEGEPSPAEIQAEFYYRTFTDRDPRAWLAACEQHAKGEYWPSIDALTLTLKQYRPDRLALVAPDGIDMPEEVRVLIDRIGQEFPHE